MVGLFDSGSGGLNTVRYLQAAGDVDLVYLIDRENAPYGIKTKKELIGIAEPLEPVVLIPIGYPTVNEPGEKNRKSMDEVFVNLESVSI